MSTSRASRRVYGGQSHADRMSERRAAFVEAGFELIGTEGYRAATVRAVCKQAGVTDRYFYELFGNTEGLLIAVYQAVAEELQQSLIAALADAEDNIEAKTEAGLRAFFSFMRDDRNARIMMAEILGVSADVTALYMHTSQVFATLLITAASPLAPGVIDPNQPDNALFGQSLVGAIIYAAGAWALSGYREPEDVVIASCRMIVIGAWRQRMEELAQTTPVATTVG